MFTGYFVNKYNLLASCCIVIVGGIFVTGASAEEGHVFDQFFSKQYVSAVSNDDAEAFAALFTEDGLRIPPNRDPEGPRSEIKTGVQRVFDKFDFLDFEVIVESSRIEGDFAWVSANASGSRKDGENGKTLPINVRYVMIMRKTGEDWKIFRQSWYPIK